MKLSGKEALSLLRKYKYLLLVLAVGGVLIFWPTEKAANQNIAQDGYELFDLAAAQSALCQAISRIQGAGEVEVVLSLQTDMTLVLQENQTVKSDARQEGEVITRKNDSESETVLVGSGASTRPVVIRRVYPEYRGALVVCEGARNPAVKLAVLEAVSAVTGLGTDKITVTAMEMP